MKSRKLLTFVTAVLALFALSGCMRVHENLTLHTDNTVTGSILMAYDRAILEMSGVSEADLDELLGGEGLADLAGTSVDGITVSDYEEDGYVGYLMEFTAMPLEDLESGAGFSITREGDEFIVTADFGAVAEDLSSIPTNMLAAMDFRTTVSFPGAIIEQRGGVVEGNTVTWVTSFTEPNDIYGRAHAIAGAGSGVPVWVPIAGAGVLAALLVTVLLVVLVRRKPSGGVVPDVGGAGFEGIGLGVTGLNGVGLNAPELGAPEAEAEGVAGTYGTVPPLETPDNLGQPDNFR